MAATLLLPACSPQPSGTRPDPAPPGAGAILRAGSTVIYQADLDHELKEKHGGATDDATRKRALADLATRAQFTAAALAAGLDHDPAVRAETARFLATSLRQQQLLPRLKALNAPLPEARLRELYEAGRDRYRSSEKRQAAVLWLNPRVNPEREQQYTAKLTAARDWFFASSDVKNQPGAGFSVLSVDHSEHAASRYKGGDAGWFEREGGMDAWSKAVAGIVFSLNEPGDVSPVVTRAEGVFLVRYMALKPAVQRTFDEVSLEIERAERQRLRAGIEAEFAATIKAAHPVEWLTPAP